MLEPPLGWRVESAGTGRAGTIWCRLGRDEGAVELLAHSAAKVREIS